MKVAAPEVLAPFESIMRLERELADILEKNGFAFVFVPTFAPLSNYSERIGDELQSAYITLVLEGEQVLRPEFTTSICRMVLDTPPLRDFAAPLRLSYAGQTFRVHRRPSLFPHERRQLGGEIFGAPPAEGDFEVLRLICELLRQVGGEGFSLRLGHADLLDCVLRGLGAARPDTGRIKRDLRRMAVHRKRLSAGNRMLVGLLPRLLTARGKRAGLDGVEARCAAATEDPSGDLLLSLEREIVKREWELGGVPPRVVTFLDELAGTGGSIDHLRAWLIEGEDHDEARGIIDYLELLIRRAGFAPDSAADRVSSNETAIAASIDATIVRGVSYYSGLLFELADNDGIGVGGGGRYDRLMALLGDDGDGRTAIGFALDLGHLATIDASKEDGDG